MPRTTLNGKSLNPDASGSNTVLVVEEVRYDFEEFPKYADDFVRDLLKLMIIAKMNAAVKNPTKKRKDDSIKLLFSKSEIAQAIVALMKQ